VPYLLAHGLNNISLMLLKAAILPPFLCYPVLTLSFKKLELSFASLRKEELLERRFFSGSLPSFLCVFNCYFGVKNKRLTG